MCRSCSVLLLLLASGCSFLFTTAPPERVTASTTLNCTTSRAAPAIDAISTGVEAAFAIGYVNSVETPEPAPLLLMLAWTALYSASAIYGFTVTSACGDATERRDELVEQRDDSERRERAEWRWRQLQQQRVPVR